MMASVFGDHGVAAAGNLICVPAGAAKSVERIRPYLQGVSVKIPGLNSKLTVAALEKESSI